MIRYMIHSSNERHWYVEGYLIPKLVEQGVCPDEIYEWRDTYCDGNLFSTMDGLAATQSFGQGSIWHLQDDVAPALNFVTESRRLLDDYPGIACGFCGQCDQNADSIGDVTRDRMWYSFPCILIPNDVATSVAEWFYSTALRSRDYRDLILSKKGDDKFFQDYVSRYYDGPVHNIAPNLVDHIDYLIGGSLINGLRSKDIRAKYFDRGQLADLESYMSRRCE